MQLLGRIARDDGDGNDDDDGDEDDDDAKLQQRGAAAMLSETYPRIVAPLPRATNFRISDIISSGLARRSSFTVEPIDAALIRARDYASRYNFAGSPAQEGCAIGRYSSLVLSQLCT